MLFPVAPGDIIEAAALNTLNSAAAWFSEDTGSADAYQLTFTGDPPNNNDITALTNGQIVSFVAAADNSGAATLQINSLGAMPLTKNGASSLEAGDVTAGQMIVAIYNADQSRFEIVGTSNEGMHYVPVTDSSPSDTPTSPSGFVTMRYDTSADVLWVYNGAWKSVALS